ncbi:MAG: flavodoxin family protein [Candidatus Diapherotrites archaeon]|nr:flavodoxin family protein [Candidatus Diapherotrites archaeon]
MKTAIICVSKHHGNTKKIAKAMAKILKADIFEPKDVKTKKLEEYDFIGLGSGIYAFKHDKEILELACKIPKLKSSFFIFSTSGSGNAKYHKTLKKTLESKGNKVIGEFACPGYDTFAIFKLFGGLNKGRPNKDDLAKAEDFAKKILNKKISPGEI